MVNATSRNISPQTIVQSVVFKQQTSAACEAAGIEIDRYSADIFSELDLPDDKVSQAVLHNLMLASIASVVLQQPVSVDAVDIRRMDIPFAIRYLQSADSPEDESNTPPTPEDRIAALEARVADLENDVARLRRKPSKHQAASRPAPAGLSRYHANLHRGALSCAY